MPGEARRELGREPAATEPVLCLIGPTAAGKSSLALQWVRSASQSPIEIISLDSAQVYRGLDLGTAKPSAAERAEVPHHLLDLRDPEEPYSVAQGHADVLAAVSEIRQRGATPLIVGGTMLYFKALLEGLDQLPEAEPEVRAQISEQAEALGWPALHARLLEIDPQTAGRLAPQDAQRIGRALEVWEQTGRTLSDWQEASQRSPRARLQALPMRTVALIPESRAWLHQRIAHRFEQMVRDGLLEEVAGLIRRPGLRPEHPSMRSVGYRQAWMHLRGELSREDFVQRGVEATRQLAKRQITWLRAFEQRGAATALPAETADWGQAMRVWSSPG